jgi:anti-sigma factor RsiW
MTCQDALHLLHPYSDGELDLVRLVEIEQHFTECAECGEQLKNLRSLRAAISSPALYYRAQAALRTRVQLSSPSVTQVTQVTQVTRQRRPSAAQWAAIAAGLLLLIGSSTTIGILLSRAGSADDRLAELVVAGHVRSLQADHLRDVVSTDRHTVKPWFRGKLDFSPQVPDLSTQGYPLSGGRLDYLADRPVAALVYYRRLHAINLFTWPAGNDEEKTVRVFARQGFHVRYWQRTGMTYWAISDLNDQEFDEFVRLFQEQSRELRP